MCKFWAEGALTRFAPKPNEIFIDYVPTTSRADFDAKVPLIKLTTLPASIRGTHSWTFKLLDARRKEMLGADGVTVTGVHTRSETLSGFCTNVAGNCFTKICAAGVAAADEVAQESEDAVEIPEPCINTSIGMLIETMDFLGWRTSYGN